ncbi:hypothetical protein P6709_05430 [Jeotgalibacillus sp. ET6]|uniref:hypothetical protein n=1 Tax=Jeotgalibacillus sp. ET6 TaxID=3037260 RepID=UPI0024183728|nr:hypothetical protein [Jeotgalibacillus sp. ET6]MDG5471181.1 hypothetical protein [Jeotgalibacillus sp. ET6]
MKKRLSIIMLSLSAVLTAGVIYFEAKLFSVKANVKEENPGITSVQSISVLGGWGEWFSAYSLVVVQDGKIVRVWTDGDGKLTDELPL